MRVLLYTSIPSFQKANGGKTVVLKTKEYLERAGVQVDLLDPWRMRIADYDLIHCFTMETTDFWHYVKASQIKLVVTPISWFGVYATRRSQIMRTLKRTVQSKIKCPLHGYWWEDAFSWPDLFFPQSVEQARQLHAAFGVSPSRIRVVPHGVDPRFLSATLDAFVQRYGIRDFVLCVGRFEPRKNQLALIQALKGTGLPLVFIGRPDASAYEDYYDACVREAQGTEALFIRDLDHESPLLSSAYAAASVLALPSELEFPGVVILEAGLAGCSVAVTKVGVAHEYLGDRAEYMDPYSLDSIRDAVLKAARRPRPDVALREHVRTNYLWETVVRGNIAGYEAMIGPTLARS